MSEPATVLTLKPAKTTKAKVSNVTVTHLPPTPKARRWWWPFGRSFTKAAKAPNTRPTMFRSFANEARWEIPRLVFSAMRIAMWVAGGYFLLTQAAVLFR